MQVCSICKKSDDNPINYGEFMKRSDVCVHYYCLLLSTNLPQKGLDYSGILGFLIRDIRIEIKNASKRICCYCKQKHASIACRICKKYFHNICGDKKGCVSEFVNEFHSYCHKHVPFGKEEKLPNRSVTSCWICHEALGEYNPTQTLRAYCCNNGYVHRYCVRKYALAAGYHLVCVWCSKKGFRDDVRKHGVFVPDREAIWDNNETLRYTDLHRGYSQCDAKVCLCPQGREFFRGPWKLIVCCMCGGSGVHSKCGRDQICRNNYTCETCRLILTESKNRQKTGNAACNYTMFMSKTFDGTEQVLQVVNSADSDSQEQELVEETEKEDKGEENKDQRKDKKDQGEEKKDQGEAKKDQGEEKDDPGEENEDQGEENEDQREDKEHQEEEKEDQGEQKVDQREQKEDQGGPTPSTNQHPKQANTQNNLFLSGQSSQNKCQIRELFMFGKKGHILGTAQVEKSKLKHNPDKTITCKEKDVLGFSSSDSLLNSIFSDIVAEGRELSEDMVNEVFDRYKLLLENFGDCDD